MATISQQINSQNMRITPPHLNSINSISPSSQNLSISPSSQLNGRPSPGQNLTNPNPNSPGKISRTGSTDHPDICESPGASTGSLTNNTSSSKENPLNMSMNNSDMRSNSIAALRIKAKEHLESMSKGLTIV